MGWLSRTSSKASGEQVGRQPAPTEPAPTAPPADGPGPAGDRAVGRYGPLVRVTGFDVAAPELEWQLPLNGELYRVMPGSDRPDYSLLVLERPLHFYPTQGFDLTRVEAAQQVQDRKGRTMVRVHALLLCARFVGEQLHPGMRDLAVNLAYVVDNSLARDAEVDFAKIEFAATGFLSEGHAPRAGETEAPAAADAPADAPVATEAHADPVVPAAADGHVDAEPATRHAAAEVFEAVAATLREGVAAQRGEPVTRMTAALTLDEGHRLTGLSGNADGQPPAPTPETFERIGELLAGLAGLGGQGRVAAVTLRVDGDAVTHEVTRTHEPA